MKEFMNAFGELIFVVVVGLIATVIFSVRPSKAEEIVPHFKAESIVHSLSSAAQ